jgi:uncharacterized protein
MPVIAADIFGTSKALVGMVHVHALPGTPRHHQPLKEIVDHAVLEARLLVEAGFDAVMIENMHDVPYLRREVGPEVVASMTAVGRAVREAIDVPLGVQILAGANREAVAVAHAIGAQFVRVEGFLYAAVADEGLLDEADAGHLMRYRKQIGAESVRILADIKKKHSAHALTQDVSLAEFARAAEFFGADGVIVTGVATGRPTAIDDIKATRSATKLPLCVGSGARPESARDLYTYADALIVGAWLKQRGEWHNPLDPDRVKDMVAAASRARL